jgi:predicted nucleotide-binding protein
MARRPPQSPPPPPPVLSPEQIRRRIEGLQRCIAELQAFDPQRVEKRRNVTEVVAIETSIMDALGAAFGHGTSRFNLYKDAARLDQGPLSVGPLYIGAGPRPNYAAQEAQSARHYLAEGKERSVQLLQGAIRTLESEIAEQEQLAQPALRPVPARSSSKVFVVHGHDEAAREAMARFLEKIELEAIILHEQPDQGLTIIEKFEAYASQVGFAVVLLTPDDLGGPASAPAQAARARQNVIFELGYFVGKLGRGRACLLRKGEVEIPSDLYGVIYTDMDAAEGWKLKLVKELKAAGLNFDANKVWA